MPPPAGTKAPRTAEMLAKMRKQPYNPHGGQKNDTGRPALPPPPNGSNGNPAVDFFRPLFGNKKISVIFAPTTGGLAQLARALAWHARGHQFDPGILHNPGKDGHKSILIFLSESVPCIHKYPPLSSCSDRAQTGRGTIRIRTKPRAGSARAKNRQSAAKKTQSPVIQDNDRQRTRLLKKISALYRHYREHRF